MTDLAARWLEKYARPKDVSIKITAAIVVSLLKKVDAPAPPNRVWLAPPPKAAPISAPLPVCRSTINIKAKATTMWIIIMKFDISKPLSDSRPYSIAASIDNEQ
jgi:hypothetical protein